MTNFKRRNRAICRVLILVAGLSVLATSPAQAATNTNWFHIVSLATSNVVAVPTDKHAGILAVSSDHVFASRVGSSDFRRWDADGLVNETNIELGYVIVSDLRTEKVYALGNGDGPLTGSGDATALYEVDAVTGETNGAVINLSTNIPVSTGCSPDFGVYCGWGRVVMGRNPLFDVAIPSGAVTDLGVANPFNQFCDPPEPLTGIAEFFGDELYLVACHEFVGGKFERVRVSDGQRTKLKAFSSLPRSTKFSFSPSRNRWYFSTRGGSQFSAGRAVGYANAVWDQTDVLPPPPQLTVDLPSAFMNEDTVTNVPCGLVQPENAGETRIEVVASSNPALLPTSAVTAAGSGSVFGEDSFFTVHLEPLPNQYGDATLTFLTTNQIGGRVTNTMAVHVASVGDAPQIAVSSFTNFGKSVFYLEQDSIARQTNVFYVRDADNPAIGTTFSFATDNPVLLPLSGVTVTTNGTNYTLVIEAVPNILGQGRIYVTPTDADGVVGVTESFFLISYYPTGIRRAETMANTDFRVFAQGGLRNLSLPGSTTLSVTGLVGQVHHAWLYTHSRYDKPRLNWSGTLLYDTNTFDGGEIVGYSGESTESSDPSVTTRFDLTGLVTTNGVYTLGLDNPLGMFFYQINGFSLLVFHDDGNATNNQDVTIFHGNDSNYDDPAEWHALLNDIVYGGGAATLGLHVAYGELIPDTPIFVNGNLWESRTNLFNGLTVPGPNGGPNGFLWDVREFNLAPLLTIGTNALLFTENRPISGQDALNLVIATVAQPAAIVATPIPQLAIATAAPGMVVVSWTPISSPGFVLQQSDALKPPTWTNAPSGTTNPVVIPATLTTRFFRLFKP